MTDAMQVIIELRSPLDTSVRWKLQPAGNGTLPLGLISLRLARLRSINSVLSDKRLNVLGARKDSGIEIITYAFADADNAKFVLRAV